MNNQGQVFKTKLGADAPQGSQSILPFLAAVAVVKLALLLILGPAIFPDSQAYLSLADGILHDPSWWRDGGWNDGVAPLRLLRPYGYPLLIAGAKILAPNGYGYLIALVQSMASLATLALMGWYAGHLIPSPRLRFGLLTLCALSGFPLFDLALLTDSFYSSLFVTIFIILAAQMSELLPIRLGTSLLLGCGWALSITLRDVGLLHSFLPLLGVMLVGYHRHLGLRQTLLHVLAFALPVVAMAALVMQWNLFRTGHAFFSITGGINWLWPSINMADRGLADPFTCADAVCRAAQAHMTGKGMSAIFEIADSIWAESHPDPIQFGQIIFTHFQGVLRAHPIAYGATILGNLQFGHLANLVFNPMANANEFSQLHSALGQRLYPGTREMWQALRGGAVWQTLPLLTQILLTTASCAGLAIALIATPIRAITKIRNENHHALVALYFWIAACAFMGSYCLVHMEMRHALPVVPLILLTFGWNFDTENYKTLSQ